MNYWCKLEINVEREKNQEPSKAKRRMQRTTERSNRSGITKILEQGAKNKDEG